MDLSSIFGGKPAAEKPLHLMKPQELVEKEYGSETMHQIKGTVTGAVLGTAAGVALSAVGGLYVATSAISGGLSGAGHVLGGAASGGFFGSLFAGLGALGIAQTQTAANAINTIGTYGKYFAVGAPIVVTTSTALGGGMIGKLMADSGYEKKYARAKMEINKAKAEYARTMRSGQIAESHLPEKMAQAHVQAEKLGLLSPGSTGGVGKFHGMELAEI
jgi:hypothetical protein